MIGGGLVMYPVGWDNREVRESCGKSANVYNLGEYLSRLPPHHIFSSARGDTMPSAAERNRSETVPELNFGGMPHLSI